ncbi:putative metal-binding motif-containing protein [Corallococcus sp. AB049A]|uniref:putative metal-binding motif-containing protein n=1 Tax=Corallococcus sp. AB049A TaxID=2316721 RepID=UPI001315962C|nr:putative metal-binding motif-containing protein [Corallococcus sp. AB049A]
MPSLEDLWREKGFCAVGDEDCGMLRIRVDAQGFVPGCLKFEAKEAGGTGTLTATAPYRGTARAGKTLTQGFSPPKDWGLGVTVSVSAFEQGCDGKAVTEQGRQSTLREGGVSEVAFALVASDVDGDGYASVSTGGTDCSDERAEVNPGAAELCNEADDNCDGTADDGLGVGEACIAENTCAGIKVCGPGGMTLCSAPNAQLALVDEDMDGHGAAGRAPVPTCGSQLPANRLPLNAPNDDCDDTNPSVQPGAAELCNDLDDNCNNTRDEGFSLGSACTDAVSLCPGTIMCSSISETRCQPSVVVPTWYPDDDLDSYGAPVGAMTSCVKPDGGFVPQSGDCDDGNPFIHANAVELCDEQDNNCNSLIDEDGACRDGAPFWSRIGVADGGVALRGMALFGDGGVWIVGQDSFRAVKESASRGFTVLPGKCSGGTAPRNLYSVWVHPQTGVAYIGGEEDALSIQTPSSTSCEPVKPPAAAGTTTGLKGFAGSEGGVVVFGAASSSSGVNGGTFMWDGGLETVPVVSHSGQPLYGVDGVSPDQLFAVGEASGRSRILRGRIGPSGWVPETTVPDAGALRAVQVVNTRLAYAVGDNGTLLTWDGTRWFREPFPASNGTLTGVLAFGRNSVYVTSDLGRIYRYDGQTWASFDAGLSLYAIEGTSPEDIWAVGNFGQVFHYPGWPQ